MSSINDSAAFEAPDRPPSVTVAMRAASAGTPDPTWLSGLEGSRVAPMTNICVGVATRGRPEVLQTLIQHLERQTLQPTVVLVACTAAADVGVFPEAAHVTVLIESPGLTRQRNAILRHVQPEAEIVVFFDDDFVPQPGWLAAIAEAFRIHPKVGCITGWILADGIKGPGLDVDQALTALAADDGSEADEVEPGYSPYGCNMAIRRSAIGNLRFDERLVLYGWLEDRDFGGALVQGGWELMRIGMARGVHLGVKKGRVAGTKLGYSQVMNPIYLTRKGTMPVSSMLEHVVRNALANLVRSFAPEPYVDRRGRLLGNLIAFTDVLRGRITPERAQSL